MRSDYESFSKRVATEDILAGRPVPAALAMNDTDRRALAEALDLPGVAALQGEIQAARRAGLIEVEGRVRATLLRRCVATLGDMTEEIDEPFEVVFTETPDPEREGEFEADLDSPEPVQDGVIDLGGILLEQLVLAMDPHPRIEGADPLEDPGAGAKITPFDVLEDLKKDG